MNPKFNSKYGSLTEIWWRTPQEDFLLADLYARAYAGLGVGAWLLTSIGIILTVLDWATEDMSGMILWGSLSLAFGAVGLYYMSKSGRSKLMAAKSRLQYQEAKAMKEKTEETMKKEFLFAQSDLHETLHDGLNRAKDFTQVINLFSEMTIVSKEALDRVKKLYSENKLYDYNLNEPKEIEAFQEVDSYKCYDDIYQHLFQVIDQISRCKDAAEREAEVDFQQQTDRLIELIPDVSASLEGYTRRQV